MLRLAAAILVEYRIRELPSDHDRRCYTSCLSDQIRALREQP